MQSPCSSIMKPISACCIRVHIGCHATSQIFGECAAKKMNFTSLCGSLQITSRSDSLCKSRAHPGQRGCEQQHQKFDLPVRKANVQAARPPGRPAAQAGAVDSAPRRRRRRRRAGAAGGDDALNDARDACAELIRPRLRRCGQFKSGTLPDMLHDPHTACVSRVAGAELTRHRLQKAFST